MTRREAIAARRGRPLRRSVLVLAVGLALAAPAVAQSAGDASAAPRLRVLVHEDPLRVTINRALLELEEANFFAGLDRRWFDPQR